MAFVIMHIWDRDFTKYVGCWVEPVSRVSAADAKKVLGPLFNETLEYVAIRNGGLRGYRPADVMPQSSAEFRARNSGIPMFADEESARKATE